MGSIIQFYSLVLHSKLYRPTLLSPHAELSTLIHKALDISQHANFLASGGILNVLPTAKPNHFTHNIQAFTSVYKA
jgi:hypothetical protein